MNKIKYFKNDQYGCLVPEKMPEGTWGYLCKGYILEDDEIYLVSGNSNVKHNINDLKENYRTHIIQLIDSMEDKIFN